MLCRRGQAHSFLSTMKKSFIQIIYSTVTNNYAGLKEMSTVSSNNFRLGLLRCPQEMC